MSLSKIDWCDRTINPVIGCAHGCSYCYAEKANDRFKKILPDSFAKDFKKPQFFPKKMKEAYEVKKPSIFFVGSMTDPAFWTVVQWVEIIKMCIENERHTFMFLTKDPVKAYPVSLLNNYMNIELQNMMFGYTEDFSGNHQGVSRVHNLQYVEFISQKVRTFMSVEPLLGPIPKDFKFSHYEKVILGAMTGKGAIRPEKDWIASAFFSIPKAKLFLKGNIKKILKENSKEEGLHVS